MQEILKRLLGEVKVPKRRKQRGGRPSGLLANLCTAYMKSIPDTPDEVIAEYWEFFEPLAFRAFRNGLGGPRHYQSWRPRPSGQKCTREEGIKKLGLYVPKDTSHQGKFTLGHFYEAWTKVVALLAGAKIHSFNMKVTIPLPPGMSCPVCKEEPVEEEGNVGVCTCAEIDCLLDIGKDTWLVDVKSSRGMAFKWITTPYDDKWGYFKQQRLYMMSRELKGKIKGGVLLFVSKADGATFKEVLVPLPTGDHREEWFSHCRALEATKSPTTLPSRPDWATSREKTLRKPVPMKVESLEAIQCQLCDTVNVCWGKAWRRRDGKADGEWIRP